MADFNKRAILGYTPEMSHTLKSIALASLAFGAGVPLLRELYRPENPLMLPTSGGAYASIPVPESSMSEAAPYYELPTKKKKSKSVKELKNFDIAKVVKSGALSVRPHSLLSERSFTTEGAEKRSSDFTKLLSYLWNNDLISGIRGAAGSSGGSFGKDTLEHITTNPYFLPGAVVAGAVPMIAGNMLSKSLIRKRDYADKKDDTDEAKLEFSKALMQAQENSPVRQVIKAGSGNRDIDELYENLEKLASVALDDNEKRASWLNKYIIDPIAGLIPNGRENLQRTGGAWNLMSEAVYGRPDQDPKTYNPLQYVFSGAPGATVAAIDAAKAVPGAIDDSWNFLKRYGGKALTGVNGAMLAGGLLAGGAGTYYGARAAKNEDTETEESYKYLSEFLRRQQEEGTPINVMPVPVAPKVKKPWYSMG
jgi:hypothetical protein